VHDGTVYSPECDCIYFAELHPPKAGFSADAMPWVWRVSNLNTTTPTTEKVYPSPSLTMANGAYYHNGSVYWAQEGNYTTPGGIVRMNPVTLQTEVVLNNFMGHRFNSPNDVVITRRGVVYFTDGYYGFDNFNDTLRPELANGLWRWDMGGTNNLRMVAGAAGGPFVNPNGVALNLAEDRIYVTNRGNASDNPAGGRTIYEFELHDDDDDDDAGVPVRGGDVFAYADAGFPDGVKLDRDGRVYGGVTGGVSVFDRSGKQLGLIKVADGDVAVNMVWVENWLYIAGRDYLYRVQLNTGGAQTF
jgi:sugar lactone lactonase YvrE